jgi:hypothetical protein
LAYHSPALAEGEKRSAKAADDIEQIAPLLDGTILFDNETWLKKIAHRRDKIVAEMNNDKGFLGFGKNAPKMTPQEVTDRLLNQNIIRRISLILRAGEFRADGGIDLAEVVMDSSEVLNTIKGMGFVAIGYSVEHLKHSPLAFLSKLRSPDNAEEQRKSAERIIELAKQAIYQEVSVPCDMTSAAKALILVAGPSHEISMKGFMTVRKWIDRSIAGMETRSGDYPVTNSSYVAIIVVLSGLQNIPRVTELQEIRDQYRYGSVRRAPLAESSLPPETLQQASAVLPEFYSDTGSSIVRNDSIDLPKEKPQRQRYEPQQAIPESMPVYEEFPLRRQIRQVPSAGYQEAAAVARYARGRTDEVSIREESPHPRTDMPGPRHPKTPARVLDEPDREIPQKKEVYPQKDISPGRETVVARPPSARSGRVSNPERIAWDLQKKREQVRHTPSVHSESTSADKLVAPGVTEVPKKKIILRKSTVKPVAREPSSLPEPGVVQEKRTVIRIRKKEPKPEEYVEQNEPAEPTESLHQEELEPVTEPDTSTTAPLNDEAITPVKDSTKLSRDDMFLGKAITKKETLKSKDSSLLHTNIGTKKTKTPALDETTDGNDCSQTTDPRKKKPRKPSSQGNDITWVSD